MTTWLRRAQTLLVPATALFLALGCAAAPDEEGGHGYQVEPYAVEPRLDIDWRRALDPIELWEYRARQYATPAMYRTSNSQVVVVGTDGGEVVAVRAGDGAIEWTADVQGPVHATPAIDESAVYVGTLHGEFYAMDRETGAVRWKHETDREVEGRAAVGDERVFYTTNADRLLALEKSTGEIAWTHAGSTPEEFTSKGTGRPAIHRDAVFCGFADGTLRAFDRESGREGWSLDLSSGEDSFADVDPKIVVEGPRLYAASQSGGLYAIRHREGAIEWHSDISEVTSLEVFEGRIYATLVPTRAVALDTEDGSIEWSYQLSEHMPVELGVAPPYVYVATGSGPLYVLDRKTGYPFSTWSPSSGFNTSPVFGGRSAYLFSNRGYLYSVRVAF